MSLLKLFISFLQIGLFSFGGGLASLPLIQAQVVDYHGWITLQEFSDLIVIAEMTPGPIAINAATFIGMQLFGPIGALVATLGALTAPLIIVSTLTWLYFKYKNLRPLQWIFWGLRPAIVAFIASAGLSIFLMAIHESMEMGQLYLLRDFSLIGVGVFFLKRFKLSPIKLIPLIGAFGTVATQLM